MEVGPTILVDKVGYKYNYSI